MSKTFKNQTIQEKLADIDAAVNTIKHFIVKCDATYEVVINHTGIIVDNFDTPIHIVFSIDYIEPNTPDAIPVSKYF